MRELARQIAGLSPQKKQILESFIMGLRESVDLEDYLLTARSNFNSVVDLENTLEGLFTEFLQDQGMGVDKDLTQEIIREVFEDQTVVVAFYGGPDGDRKNPRLDLEQIGLIDTDAQHDRTTGRFVDAVNAVLKREYANLGSKSLDEAIVDYDYEDDHEHAITNKYGGKPRTYDLVYLTISEEDKNRLGKAVTDLAGDDFWMEGGNLRGDKDDIDLIMPDHVIEGHIYESASGTEMFALDSYQIRGAKYKQGRDGTRPLKDVVIKANKRITSDQKPLLYLGGDEGSDKFMDFFVDQFKTMVAPDLAKKLKGLVK